LGKANQGTPLKRLCDAEADMKSHSKKVLENAAGPLYLESYYTKKRLEEAFSRL